MRLHRETVKGLLVNFIRSTDDPLDDVGESLSLMLAVEASLNQEEALKIVKGAIDEVLQEIIVETVYPDGEHPDIETAEEICCEEEYYLDRLVDNILNELGKKKLIFQEGVKESIVMKPERPLENYMKVGNYFKRLSGYIEWFDKHFSEEGFFYLAYLDRKKIDHIHIVCGPERVDRKFKFAYQKAKREFAFNNIKLELKVIIDMNLIKQEHVRFLIDENEVYVVPPTSIMVDKFDVIQPVMGEKNKKAMKLEFDKLWHRAVDPLKGNVWGKIQKIRNSASSHEKSD